MIRRGWHLAWMVIWPGAIAVAAANAKPPAAVEAMVSKHCLDCHTRADASGGIDLETIRSAKLEPHRETWERVVRKLRARLMPPGDWPRPDEATYRSTLDSLEQSLDRIAEARPRPGRTASFRRLTRIEYQNAIRDLLAVTIDAAILLPRDESSLGFDNVTVGELSPLLLERYLSAAQKISRMAVGNASDLIGGEEIRVRPDLTQDYHLPGLPLGTRGGMLIPHHFPQDGEYEIQVRLARDRNEHVEGLGGEHELDVLLDRHCIATFTVQPPSGGSNDHSLVDAHLKTRPRVRAGSHDLAVTFAMKSTSLEETMRQPHPAHFNMHRHPRLNPAVYSVSITGPYGATGPGDTASRQRVFVCLPNRPDEERACATEILATLLRRAYRRPIRSEDLEKPLELFEQGQAADGFEAGIELAVASVLVSPHFLFRIEREPPEVPSGKAYRIDDVELASRLSFFLWSSIPDDELLMLAEGGELYRPEVLRRQVERMLADSRADAMITNFAGQWLHLRNLASVQPDRRSFPGFDDNLRQALRRETELLFESIVRENRSVLDLIRADYTFLNERLARHYGIPHVHGSRFRRVALDDGSHRGGLLRHASILTVTSYATRTSPVLRGQWILKNLLGIPPPPPPADVPALEDNVAADLPIRERLLQHRADANCASCHQLIDPVGFSLENYDAVGRWRTLDAGQPVDASGGLPDGSQFISVAGLEAALLERPELLVGTFVEKLLTYALGRGVDHDDAAAIRRIVRDAREEDYRFRSLIQGIVRSTPFQMRTVE